MYFVSASFTLKTIIVSVFCNVTSGSLTHSLSRITMVEESEHVIQWKSLM